MLQLLPTDPGRIGAEMTRKILVTLRGSQKRTRFQETRGLCCLWNSVVIRTELKEKNSVFVDFIFEVFFVSCFP